MDNLSTATFNIDQPKILQALGNIDIPTGTNRALYFQLLNSVYNSDGTLSLTSDLYAYYLTIFPQ